MKLAYLKLAIPLNATQFDRNTKQNEPTGTIAIYRNANYICVFIQILIDVFHVVSVTWYASWSAISTYVQWNRTDNVFRLGKQTQKSFVIFQEESHSKGKALIYYTFFI